MKIDPGAQQVIDLIKAVGRPPYETVGHMEARRLYLEARRVLQPEPMPIARDARSDCSRTGRSDRHPPLSRPRGERAAKRSRH